MIKKLLTLVLLSQLAACSSKPSSAYDSGWTNDTNEAAYKACSVYRITKDLSNPSVLENLVSSRVLTNEQAQRAISGDVRVGDPECLAYAAYGLDRHKIGTQTNNKGQFITKTATYLCSQSNVPCPGLVVRFSDGKVTGTSVVDH